MPSIAAHMVCSKLVSELLKIEDPEFVKGNLLPDIIAKQDSHHKIRGKYYLIPNIEHFIKNNDLSKNINKGYLCHLLLDKYFLEEYVLNNIKDYNKIDLFSPDLMYNDYTNLNILLVKKYKLDVKYINKVMSHFDEELNKKKYDINMSCLNCTESDELKVIDINKFSNFLEETSLKIAKYIEVIA